MEKEDGPQNCTASLKYSGINLPNTYKRNATNIPQFKVKHYFYFVVNKWNKLDQNICNIGPKYTQV